MTYKACSERDHLAGEGSWTEWKAEGCALGTSTFDAGKRETVEVWPLMGVSFPDTWFHCKCDSQDVRPKEEREQMYQMFAGGWVR